MGSKKIEARILKGFRDYLPQVASARLAMIRTLENIFRLHGFSPIDTPALEYTEVLLGKGSEETDKQLYRFFDNGERDIALRFDLTVPLARFVAQHFNDLPIPFRRFHIAPVWRAEKPQKGRYREFIQCDFDIIGCDDTIADAEIASVIYHALTALNLDHTIRINNRALLNALTDSIGASDKTAHILRAIDKLEKLGEAVVRQELQEQVGLNANATDQIFQYLALGIAAKSIDEVALSIAELMPNSKLTVTAVNQIKDFMRYSDALGIPKERLAFDCSIARGLDYYTGMVFETKLNKLASIGSIASGGRYDNLVGVYSKQELSGVGASIGLDRILGALEELAELDQYQQTTQVFVTLLEEQSRVSILQIVEKLRLAGIPSEPALSPGKLKAQLKLADRKKIPYLLIAGAEEINKQSYALKNMISGEQIDNLTIEAIVQHVRN